MSGLVAELKRRNIFRVVTVYAVASWVILQLADITFPALDIAESDIRYVIIALMVGFPVVVGFSWLFEITPEGLQRSGRVIPEESISGQTGRKIDFVIIGLLSVALLFFMSEYFSQDETTPETVERLEIAEPVPEVPSKPTVAVLPFVNMSSDQENEHFADGLTEELLNVLARNEELQVAGRTSSFFYKGKNINLKQIGEELSVTNILEGSVRKSGNMVRVTAQLINSETGYHLWSETFDREIKDIFAIQDEIALKVGEAMNLTLVANNSTIPGATTNIPEAHDAYLKGKSRLYDRRRASLESAIEEFQRSIELDRSYGPPLVGLAEAYLVAQNNHQLYELTDSAEQAKEALDQAESIGYKPSEYYSTLGLLHHHLTRVDLDQAALAREAYEKAIELNDSNISAYMWLGTLLTEEAILGKEVDSVDRFAQAVQLDQMALKLDPKNRVANGNLQINLFSSGQFDQAMSNLEKLAAVDPDYTTYASILANFHFMRGDFANASEWVLKTEGMSSRETWLVLRLVRALNSEELVDRFFAQLNDNNPLYDRLVEMREAHNLTPAELIAKAQVALLQPDHDGWSGPFADALYLKGEYEWSKKLQENISQELTREVPRITSTSGNFADYAATLYLAGYDQRARNLAAQGLQANKGRIRIAPRGKWLDDATYYMILDRTEEAVIEIESAYSEGFRQYYLVIDENPIYDPIRTDPRIIALKQNIDQYIAQEYDGIETNLLLAGAIAPLPPATNAF